MVIVSKYRFLKVKPSIWLFDSYFADGLPILLENGVVVAAQWERARQAVWFKVVQQLLDKEGDQVAAVDMPWDMPPTRCIEKDREEVFKQLSLMMVAA